MNQGAVTLIKSLGAEALYEQVTMIDGVTIERGRARGVEWYDVYLCDTAGPAALAALDDLSTLLGKPLSECVMETQVSPYPSPNFSYSHSVEYTRYCNTDLEE